MDFLSALQDELVVEEPGFCQGGALCVAEEGAHGAPAAFTVPGGDGVAHNLVAGVGGEGGHGHAVCGVVGITKEAVAGSKPDAGLSIRLYGLELFFRDPLAHLQRLAHVRGTEGMAEA